MIKPQPQLLADFFTKLNKHTEIQGLENELASYLILAEIRDIRRFNKPANYAAMLD